MKNQYSNLIAPTSQPTGALEGVALARFLRAMLFAIVSLGLAASAHATPTAMSLTPMSEMNALFPIVGLIFAIGLTHLLRQHRLAQLATIELEDGLCANALRPSGNGSFGRQNHGQTPIPTNQSIPASVEISEAELGRNATGQGKRLFAASASWLQRKIKLVLAAPIFYSNQLIALHAMKNRPAVRIAKVVCALAALCLLSTSSAWATVVTWNLNPNGTEGAVGSSSHTFSSSGYDITASGYTVGSPNTPLGLYFKNQGYDETGLGIVGPADHELQGSGSSPLQFIQLDVSAIIAQGFSNGKIEIGSVQGTSNDTFAIWGSSTAGSLGQRIGGTYDSTSDMVFVNIAHFGDYNYISVGALSGDVLPVAFRASLTAVPEVGALFPIVGLIAAVSLTQFLRRRRMSQLRTGAR